jgi:hypothetical protein
MMVSPIAIDTHYNTGTGKSGTHVHRFASQRRAERVALEARLARVKGH